MKRPNLIRTTVFVQLFGLLAIMFMACEAPTSTLSDNSPSQGFTSAESDAGFLTDKKGPPSSATMKFGRTNVGSPFPPPAGHDASTHAQDALQPRTVVVSVGGEVTFEVAPFHKLAIYDDGTRPADIDISLLEEAGTPFPFPPIIDDPTNRLVRLGDLAVDGPAVSRSFTFDEPGRYLVICEVLPHFADNGMYGWVIVK